jgi:sporulation protein YlmC with PRC-barrel domain
MSPGFAGAYFWPYIGSAELGATIPVEQIPADELGIHRGAEVEATDGHIGHVDEFIVNPQNCHITHLVVREGHFWDKKALTVPVSDIKRIAADVVYLKSDKATLQALPTVPR